MTGEHVVGSPLPPDSDQQLLRRYHVEGDRDAREMLVQRHLPLVRALARRYAGRGEPLEDIEQVGAIGLLKAIDRYELSREVALTTYATPNVVGEIKRHFRDRGWAIRIPRGLQELNSRMSGAVESLTSTLGRPPTVAEIARRAGREPGAGARGARGGVGVRADVALRDPLREGDLDPLEALGSEDQDFERSEERATLEPALRACPTGARDPADALRGRPHADPDRRTGGISQMHVSRLIRKSLARIRAELSET